MDNRGISEVRVEWGQTENGGELITNSGTIFLSGPTLPWVSTRWYGSAHLTGVNRDLYWHYVAVDDSGNSTTGGSGSQVPMTSCPF
jgi:hypothetical protein